MSLETELAALLAAPVATLVDDTHRVPVDSRIARWDLPPSDLHALRDWGFPEGPLFRPGLQHIESAPVLLPPVRVKESVASSRQINGCTGWARMAVTWCSTARMRRCTWARSLEVARCSVFVPGR